MYMYINARYKQYITLTLTHTKALILHPAVMSSGLALRILGEGPNYTLAELLG